MTTTTIAASAEEHLEDGHGTTTPAGDNLLLDVHQKLLRFDQGQTQVGDLTKTIRPADRHHVETSRPTINPGLNQT